MWNSPSKRELRQLPGLYKTEQVPAKEKVIHLHFFIGGCDWYAAEFDGEDTFFGYAVLNGDMHNAEWGYFSLSELQSITIRGIQIDRDLYWKVRPAGEITALRGWI